MIHHIHHFNLNYIHCTFHLLLFIKVSLNTYNGLVDLLFRMNSSQCYQTFSCSTQLSMNFTLLIGVKMPTVVGIFFTFNSNT